MCASKSNFITGRFFKCFYEVSKLIPYIPDGPLEALIGFSGARIYFHLRAALPVLVASSCHLSHEPLEAKHLSTALTVTCSIFSNSVNFIDTLWLQLSLPSKPQFSKGSSFLSFLKYTTQNRNNTGSRTVVLCSSYCPFVLLFNTEIMN